jgi:hypothetical protein
MLSLNNIFARRADLTMLGWLFLFLSVYFSYLRGENILCITARGTDILNFYKFIFHNLELKIHCV